MNNQSKNNKTTGVSTGVTLGIIAPSIPVPTSGSNLQVILVDKDLSFGKNCPRTLP